MKRCGGLLAGLVVLAALAGCLGDPAAPPTDPLPVIRPDELVAGRYYAFQHAGGDLVFSVAEDGEAGIVLYDGDDRRVGRIELGAQQASGRFIVDGLEAGELVVHLLTVNGTLDIRTDGAPVGSFVDLPVHVERHVLAQRESQFPVPIAVLADGIDESLPIELERAPSDLRLLGTASYDDLDVRVEGRGGLVFELQSGTDPVPVPGLFSGFFGGTFHDENVRDGSLEARVTATRFEGSLVLEAESFSRARAVAGVVVAAAPDEVPRFTYGEIAEEPALFHVHAEARSLYLWQEPAEEQTEGCDDAADAGDAVPEGCPAEAVVALFDPDDRRVATVRVPANGTVAYPLPEDPRGEWVAVALAGAAQLGADRIPGDFELHEVEATETAAPSAHASSRDGTYVEQRETLRPDGVPVRVAAVLDSGAGDLIGGMPGTCWRPVLRLISDGETIASWGYEGPMQLDPALFLGNGDLEVEHGDYGPGCDRLVLVVHGYER